MIEMIRFLKNLKGNAKTCLSLDPVFAIPFNMYLPFVTLYMFGIGLRDVEIGILLSIATVANVFMALLGGVIVDKFGRRKTLIVGDFVAWSVPVLIWAFSQNFWWFLAAAIFNSVAHIATVAFECAWIEDLEERKLSRTINWFFILWHMTVLFALVSGFFVERYSVVPVMRALYIFAFILMNIRLVVLNFWLKETTRGRERMEAAKGKSLWTLLSEYKEAIDKMKQSKDMIRMLFLLPMVHIFIMIQSTFFALYATQNLGIGMGFIAYFPVLRSAIALFFFFVLQSRMYKFKIQYVMAAAIVLYIAGHGVLLGAPYQNFTWLIVYAILDAFAAAMFLPRFETQLFSSLDNKERARCRAVIMVVTLALASPFGALAGFLSDMDRRFPFMLNILLFVCMMFFVIHKKKEGTVKGA